MINQEVIYTHLRAGEYSKIIELLYYKGDLLLKDQFNSYAINVFLNELFQKIENEVAKKELIHDFELLFMVHREGKYKLEEEYAIKLLTILDTHSPSELLMSVAKDYPSAPICQKIIKQYEIELYKKSSETVMPISMTEGYRRGIGQMFSTEILTIPNIPPYLKVYIKEANNHQTVAEHIKKLPSVKKANVTTQSNGKFNLTVYCQPPYTIDETKAEVDLTLDNYYSGSPFDPIFEEETISSISDKAYRQVIEYIVRLGKKLEESHRLTEKWDEERFRDYFIPYLDIVSVKHSATGETWHRKGKTDILFRDQDKNILLVAECKLWNGERYLMDAIDQLFERYVNWRDEKTAIVIFNTQMQNFTSLLSKAVDTLKSHILFHQMIGRSSETSYSFIYRNPQDLNKTVYLELVVFNLT